ncbi:MAG: glycosyltransferase family 2 protein [Micrococcaceae bacterium]
MEHAEQIIPLSGNNNSDFELSIIIPIYNEEDALPHLFARLRPVLDKMLVSYEVICVDDGSSDSTARAIINAKNDWGSLRLLRLTKNSGHQAAITAGYGNCYGSYAVTLDADLQDPPELIPDMYRKAVDEKLEVVYAARNDRSNDTWFKRTSAKFYYRTMRRVAGQQILDNVADYRLISRRVLNALEQLPERDRVYRLLIPWFDFPYGTVHFTRQQRIAGKSKYPIYKMLVLTADSITNFTNMPLRVATFLGLIGSLISIIYAVYLVFAAIGGNTVPGWSSTVLLILFFGVATLLSLGVIGEYLGRLINNTHSQPSYIVGYDSSKDSSQQGNFEPKKDPDGSG